MPGTSFEPRHRTQKRQALVYRRIWVLLVRKVRTRNARKVHDPLQVDAHVQHTYTGLLLNAFQPTLWLKPEPLFYDSRIRDRMVDMAVFL